MDCKLLHGDCYEIIPTLPDSSISLVVTDPPYNLGSIHDSGMFSEKNYEKYGRTRNIKMLHNLEKLDSVVFEPTKLLDMLEPKMKSFYGYFFCNKLLVADYINWARSRKYTYDILTMEKKILFQLIALITAQTLNISFLFVAKEPIGKEKAWSLMIIANGFRPPARSVFTRLRNPLSFLRDSFV